MRTQEAKDPRLNLSKENTAAVNRICELTGENHKELLGKLLAAEEARIQIQDLDDDYRGLILKVDKISGAIRETILSFSKEQDVFRQNLRSELEKENEDLKKTILSLTEKDHTSKEQLEEKNREIDILKKQLIEKETEIQSLREEYDNVMRREQKLDQILEKLNKVERA